MKKKTIATAITAALLALGAAAAFCAVPPPPVNQSLFIYDTSFANFTVNDCFGCHGSDHDALATRHHALLNNVPAPSCINASQTLPATLATGCHILVPGSAGGFQIQDPKQCFNCHSQSPHHTTVWAADRDCKHCHGAAVDNTNDGHYIPSYPMNTNAGGVTPGPVGRTVANPAVPGTTIVVQGCAACHQANPTASPRPINANMDTHHGTGIGQGAPGSVGVCQWCHGSGPTSFTIRACEACHGVNSLHSIQADTPAAANVGTISPGNEAAGYGHIGNTNDCSGCHFSLLTSASTGSGTTATVPVIQSLSRTAFTVGKAATLTINGDSFVNLDDYGNTTYEPAVTLTNSTGVTTKLIPAAKTFDANHVTVIIPDTLAAGAYELRVDKNGTFSNLTKITVLPEVAIKSAILSGQTLTITGTGFGSTPSAEFKSLLNVKVDGVQAKLTSWSDTKIVVTGNNFSAGKTVIVNTLLGPTSNTIFGSSKKVK